MFVRVIAVASLSLTLLSSPASQAQSSVSQADINLAKAEIEQLKQDLQIKEAQLRVLELQLARQASLPTPAPAKKPSARPVVVNAPAKTTVATPVAAATPTPQALLRANVDPAPYEASIIGSVPTFRMTASHNWLVLDEKRMVYWILDDEAYLLNLSDNCPELLNAARLKLENFSTKVRAGKDSVMLGDQRCLIATIDKLGGRNLPKPPR